MNRSQFLLRLLVASQVLFGSVFLLDIVASVFALPVPIMSWQFHELMEILAALGLLLGSYFGVKYAIRQKAEADRAASALKAATGALSGNINDQFSHWGLTPAERDVGWLLVKGFAISEIANLRGTSEGTIKSQSNAIYRKAGVSGRAQLLASFVEDLLFEADPDTSP